jgi:hypothetical protein
MDGHDFGRFPWRVRVSDAGDHARYVGIGPARPRLVPADGDSAGTSRTLKSSRRHTKNGRVVIAILTASSHTRPARCPEGGNGPTRSTTA